MKALVAQLKLEPHVTFSGYVPDSEVSRYYAETLAVIYVPEDEPFGLVPLEAMLHKTAVIVSNEGGMLETVLEQVQDKIRLGKVSAEKEAQMIGSLRTVLDQFVAGEEMDFSLLGGDAGLLSVAIAFRQPSGQAFISEILVFDPAAALAASGLPVLILNGDRDMQVKPSPDADLLEAAALSAGLLVVRRDIAEADHVFKVEQTPVEELGPHLAVHYNAEGRVIHLQLVETIAEWLKKQQADA